MYKLEITKFVENPDYEEDMKEYKERMRGYHNMDSSRLQAMVEKRKLEVELTDSEYQEVKKLMLTKWE